MKRYTLMIPGPMEADEDVLSALGQQIPPHYESEFAKSFFEIEEMLKKVFKTKNDIIVISGSGTAGACAGVATLMKAGEKALIYDNGAMSGYFERLCASVGVLTERVSGERARPIHPDKIRDALKKDLYDAVMVCHNESSTSMANPLKEISEVAHEFNLPIFVDSISGVAGIELRTDEWGLDVVCGASQKAICVPPGLAFVSVSEFAWKIMEKKAKERTVPLYVDLLAWRKAMKDQADWHPTMTTASTTLLAGLEVSLKKILDEGVDERIARFKRGADMLKKGMINLGFSLLVDPEYASTALTAFICPEGFDRDKVRKFLMDEYNLMIGNGDEDNEIRIAHFGRAADWDRISLALITIEDFMIREGLNVKKGQCLEGLELK